MAAIYRKTEKGQQVLLDRSVALTTRQRKAFILFDGKSTLAHVLDATRSLGTTQQDIDELLTLGLIKAVGATAPTAATLASNSIRLTVDEQQARYSAAYPIAVRLTAGLGIRGFRLNLAVEAAMDFAALFALLPKIQEAVGQDKCSDLTQALLH